MTGMAAEMILVVDDDTALSEMLGLSLRRWGYRTAHCERGDQAFAAFRREAPDLVLLDLMLPGLSGITVCTQIRGESTVPIIMLTARGDTADVVNGLEIGADDYIVKPFKVAELVARVRAQLRPRSTEAVERIVLGDLVIDVSGHRVTREEAVIALTPLEFDLLAMLARRPWKAFTREELLADVWGYRHTADTRLVNVHVQRLRSKIEPDPDQPRYVVTVRGVGYRAGG
ncbi:MAG: two-component system, OmpR family, response regulator MtrA [Actinomycetota bacterium]|nr:two-component system, OmpR family, response regulator MtrA [Actinomycetota bacterium]